jgi:mRNA interferase RelE/StbE
VSDSGPYVVKYDPRALQELMQLDKPVARRIAKSIDGLGVEPRRRGARPLVGYPGLLRIRIGDYRVVYAVNDADLVVLALRVAHRSDIYRNR